MHTQTVTQNEKALVVTHI